MAASKIVLKLNHQQQQPQQAPKQQQQQQPSQPPHHTPSAPLKSTHKAYEQPWMVEERRARLLLKEQQKEEEERLEAEHALLRERRAAGLDPEVWVEGNPGGNPVGARIWFSSWGRTLREDGDYSGEQMEERPVPLLPRAQRRADTIILGD